MPNKEISLKNVKFHLIFVQIWVGRFLRSTCPRSLSSHCLANLKKTIHLAMAKEYPCPSSRMPVLIISKSSPPTAAYGASSTSQNILEHHHYNSTTKIRPTRLFGLERSSDEQLLGFGVVSCWIRLLEG